MAPMPDRLPLATLLSQALVAFTVEFDNEAEHRIPHRTTDHGVTPGALPKPWLASLAMWANCMRHLPIQGLPVRELERRARTPTNLAGMERWGYVSVAPNPVDPRPRPPRSASIVCPTPGGLMAQQIWTPLAAEIETRWERRFGANLVDSLRDTMAALDTNLDPGLPECMPILGYGLFTARPDPKLGPPDPDNAPTRPLFALLSRALVAFAIEFESGFAPSLAICANLLRILGDRGVRVRDLPKLSGVSKEALAMAMGILQKSRLVAIEKDANASRFKVARLTARGQEKQGEYCSRLATVEDGWSKRFPASLIGDVRTALESLMGESKLEKSPLFQGLEPYPEGWRASRPKPSTLPHFPMVLHRGGFPDGS